MSARLPARRDICPHTGRARLGYDRARVLLKQYAATGGGDGLELHRLRHFAATHLGDQKVPLQLIMAKTRHKSPRTVMRYVRPATRPWQRSPACLPRPGAATEPGPAVAPASR